jgi:hypothetical protein
MTRPPELAPSSLPRQQRRRVNRQLHKLLQSGLSSVCGRPLEHNTRTTSGLDRHSNAILAGECCFDRVTELFTQIFGLGFFSERKYDFLQANPNSRATAEQATTAIAAYQKAIAETDKRFDGIERYGGVRSTHINVLDHPWMADDRNWFEQNPKRSHRMRAPLPGELDGVEIPADRVPIVLVRQVAPGSRIRGVLHFGDGALLPLPINEASDEAIAHAYFEMAANREPIPSDPQAFAALIEKYTGRQT